MTTLGGEHEWAEGCEPLDRLMRTPAHNFPGLLLSSCKNETRTADIPCRARKPSISGSLMGIHQRGQQQHSNHE